MGKTKVKMESKKGREENLFFLQLFCPHVCLGNLLALGCQKLETRVAANKRASSRKSDKVNREYNR